MSYLIRYPTSEIVKIVVQGDRLFSQAHDDLFQLNFERQRWGHVVLRPPKTGSHAAAAASTEVPPGAVASRRLQAVPALQCPACGAVNMSGKVPEDACEGLKMPEDFRESMASS